MLSAPMDSKYSVSVGDAYFFKLNWQDGNYYQHENKEEARRIVRGYFKQMEGAPDIRPSEEADEEDAPREDTGPVIPSESDESQTALVAEEMLRGTKVVYVDYTGGKRTGNLY